MDRSLRVGVAIHNAGHYHAAHDAWEGEWLERSGGADERLLHGLIQYTAAIHHARDGNWAGTVGLADSARGYLDGLPAGYRGVDLDPVRKTLEDLRKDPERIERTRPPRLVHRGETPTLSGLDAEECLVAAPILASATGYDAVPLERACTYAREVLETGESNPFLALCMDFVREPSHRDLAYRRLIDHVERRRARERDVEGLFDPGN